MKNFFGNTNSIINWDEVISSLKDGKIKKVELSDHLYGEKGFNSIMDMWSKAGYDSANSIEWINFYPEEHFDKNIEEVFSKFVNKKIVRSWISMVRPGKCAPIHVDIDDRIDEFRSTPGLERFTCHIGKPEIGHVFLLEDICFHKEPQGNVYKWDRFDLWHGGGNVGWNPKYLYNFIGCD